MLGECYRPLENIRLGQYFPEEYMPTEEERREVNRYFTPYLFYRDTRDGREIWASCCRQLCRVTLGDHDGYEAYMNGHNQYAPCPVCRRQAKLKATRYLRTKKELEEYQTVVFLREERGELLALAAWVGKDYQRSLIEEPRYHITSAARFRPGEAIQYLGFWGKNKPSEMGTVSGDIQPRSWKIVEPFTSGYGCMYHYDAYHVIGLEAIGRSAFRYCQYEAFANAKTGMHTDLMRYLAACCVWPRDMEMLVKNGMTELVSDLLNNRKKNAKIYRWGAENVREALGLDGQELRAFMATDRSKATLEIYKDLKNLGGRYSFPLAEEIRGVFRHYDVRDFLELLRLYRLDAGRALNYVKKQITPCAARHGASYKDALIAWRDYLAAAAALGCDMADEAVVMPKELSRKHDEATEELVRRTTLAAAQNDTAMLERLNKGLASRIAKYNFAWGGYIIRVAINTGEIVAEGNALKHCVGGYAARHMQGKTTILFLRRASEPGKSLATIEMLNGHLQQIHGYRNDAGKAPAEKVYAELLEVWQDWLKRGSPRHEDGTPKLRKKKGEKAA